MDLVLGTEKVLQFKRTGDNYSDETNEGLIREGGHDYLAEKLVSVAVNYEQFFIWMVIERVTGTEDFALNPQASQ